MRTLQYSILLAGCAFIILGSVPPFEANPRFAQAAATTLLLRQMEGAQVISNAVHVDPAARDQVIISVILKHSGHVAESGYGARREVVYGVEAITKSFCAEYLPSCINIQRKKVLESVSIKTDL
jgi:hypothetical protein